MLHETVVYFIDVEVRPPQDGFKIEDPRCRGDSYSLIGASVVIEGRDSDEQVCEKWHEAYVDMARFAAGRQLSNWQVSRPFPLPPNAA